MNSPPNGTRPAERGWLTKVTLSAVREIQLVLPTPLHLPRIREDSHDAQDGIAVLVGRPLGAVGLDRRASADLETLEEGEEKTTVGSAPLTCKPAQ